MRQSMQNSAAMGANFCFSVVEIEGQRVGEDFLAHEKALRLSVGVMIGLDDPALVLRDQAADRSDDADPVGAGQRQGVAAGGSHQNFSA
jgi:hypothetical protein